MLPYRTIPSPEEPISTGYKTMETFTKLAAQATVLMLIIGLIVYGILLFQQFSVLDTASLLGI
ncbi:hypothetical protein MICAG_1280007 [Microcystis aeruginosa PCC 9808]|uniref:Uncharacterized protein n=1 Tax=Microcystis aeruginosa PCC 9808 TaxID=1160284 RepID=I4HGV7_MICAE|nr:hypothetical protein MICAG_1280007 [Microcystis aeruginosa PCC 9808]